MKRLVIGILFVATLLAQVESALRQAEAAFRSGDMKRAASLARKALNNDLEAPAAHIILGVIAAQGSRWDEAVPHFQSAIRLTPHNPYGYFYLGQAYLYQQKWEKAAKYLSLAWEKNYPDPAGLLVELAFAQNEAGNAKGALATLERIQPPSDHDRAAQYHAVQAFAHAKLGQADQAVQAIRHARKLDPTNPQYWEFLLSELIHAYQISLAVKEAIEAQKKFPDYLGVQYFFGLASHHLGNTELTWVALRNLEEIEPQSPQLVVLTGLIHAQRGRFEPAMQAFTQAAKQGVQDAELLWGLTLKASGNVEGAEKQFREAVRLSPQNGQVHFELGKLLLSKGEHSQALIHLSKAAELLPRTPAIQYQLGMLYGRMGDHAKAKEYLRRVEELKRELDIGY